MASTNVHVYSDITPVFFAALLWAVAHNQHLTRVYWSIKEHGSRLVVLEGHPLQVRSRRTVAISSLERLGLLFLSKVVFK